MVLAGVFSKQMGQTYSVGGTFVSASYEDSSSDEDDESFDDDDNESSSDEDSGSDSDDAVVSSLGGKGCLWHLLLLALHLSLHTVFLRVNALHTGILLLEHILFL